MRRRPIVHAGPGRADRTQDPGTVLAGSVHEEMSSGPVSAEFGIDLVSRKRRTNDQRHCFSPMLWLGRSGLATLPLFDQPRLGFLGERAIQLEARHSTVGIDVQAGLGHRAVEVDDEAVPGVGL